MEVTGPRSSLLALIDCFESFNGGFLSAGKNDSGYFVDRVGRSDSDDSYHRPKEFSSWRAVTLRWSSYLLSLDFRWP